MKTTYVKQAQAFVVLAKSEGLSGSAVIVEDSVYWSKQSQKDEQEIKLLLAQSAAAAAKGSDDGWSIFSLASRRLNDLGTRSDGLQKNATVTSQMAKESKDPSFRKVAQHTAAAANTAKQAYRNSVNATLATQKVIREAALSGIANLVESTR